MKSKRQAIPRIRFDFWLRLNNPADMVLADIIEWLKNEHQYVRAIRDGLRLIWSLRHQNSTDVLLELFPNIRERLAVDCPPPSSDLDDLKKDIAEVKQLIQKGNHSGYVPPMENNFPLMQPANQSAGLGSGFVPTLPPQDDEDDGDLLGMTQSVAVQPQRSFIDVMLDGGLDAVFAVAKNHTADENALTLQARRKQ